MTRDADLLLALLDRWYAGDREALVSLLSELQPWLRSESRSMLQAKSLAAVESMDVVQTSLMRFLEYGPRFKPESGAQLKALLKRIARNVVIDEQRRSSHRMHRHLDSLSGASQSMSTFGPAGDSSAGPSSVAERNEEQAWIALALQFLSPDDRFLLLASEVDGMAWSKIASELDLSSADAARVRAARLKPRIANILRQLRMGRTPEIDSSTPE
jgi:RNA polymerase sigma factor (sigma-70 family)